ncbi:NUDIX domain-containing protein [Paenarthrobacter sp. RAF54_2]|uniref:NUDIX domain-containing protein n=1 Tax=Paenarthrobacter sp. RAF54_2 TaxID=3233061 RepID=UPI003F9D09AF
MSAIDAVSNVGFPSLAAHDIPADRTVIAAVVQWRDKIALFRRSGNLGHDCGLWHCITGFMEAGATPEQQTLEELFEETGLQDKDLLALLPGPDVVVADGLGNPWLIHTFTAVTSRWRLKINWENDAYRWTAPHKAKRFANRVAWLDNVLDATGHVPAIISDPESGPVPGCSTSNPLLSKEE